MVVVSSVTASPAEPSYKDDDLVYVDPDLRRVVGLVEWSLNGRPKSLTVGRNEIAEKSEDGHKPDRKRRRRTHYPWGTYRTMKKVYKIEGKVRVEERRISLDEAIMKALQEPYWD